MLGKQDVEVRAGGCAPTHTFGGPCMNRPSARAAIVGASLVLIVGVTGCTATTAGSPSGEPSSSASASAASDDSSVSPITVSAIGEPLVVQGSDGMQHVDYDVLVTNVFTAPVTLTSVSVLDAANDETLFEAEGDDLAALTESNFLQAPVDPPAEIPVSSQVSVEIDIQLPADAEVPTDLEHLVSWSVPDDAPALAFLNGEPVGELMALPLAVSDIEAVEISAPLTGDGWWSLNGCCLPNAHRSLRYAIDGSHEIKAEMFAVDWVRLTDGSFFNGDGSVNADFTYIGSDVLAVADGTVVIARDDLPDETPFEPPANVKQGDDYTGNSVVIQIAPDRYAIYGHLQPGSVAVEEGQEVKAGDVIAGLGNSGNSTAAHLHFVITDHPDFLVSTSIPFVIDEWTLQGSAVAPDGPGEIPITGEPSEQRGTHPLWQSVADFG